MPAGGVAVALVKGDRLRVAPVVLVVAAPVAQVDAPSERDILVLTAGVVYQHELLMVRARPAHPLVQQHLACLVDSLAEVDRLLLAQVDVVGVRPPHEPSHVDTPLEQPGENRAQLRPLDAAEAFVGVAPPVGEQHEIAGTQAGQSVAKAGEV